MRMAFVLWAFLIVSPSAQSQEFSSGELLRICKDANNFMKTGKTTEAANVTQCISYLRGVIESYNTLLEVTPTMDRVYCAPSGVTFSDVSKLVAKYLTNNAAELKKYSPSSMVLTALKTSYPCGEE